MGYVSDEEAKALMIHCKAFLFPTFYEGFGMPPMEALSCGARAIVSDTPTMNEVYGNTVYYINPNNANVDLEKLVMTKVEPAENVLSRFSWRKSAEMFYDTIKNIGE